MKLVTFEIEAPTGRAARLGAWVGSEVVDMHAAYQSMLVDQGKDALFAERYAAAVMPADMVGFFRAGDLGLEEGCRLLDWVRLHGAERGLRGAQLVYGLDHIKLLSPVTRPASIRDFSTFEQHQKRATKAKGNSEVPQVWYEIPVYWKANPENVIGTGEDILWPAYTEKLDFELELGAFIGKKGKDIPLEEAHTYIAGYTIFNDISARDHQAREMVMTFGPAKGKDFDTSKVLGPCVVTADEFGTASRRMQTRVNGETWSDGMSGDMYWSFDQLVSYISQSETLVPGDLLGSGACPTGCGLEINRWIQPGDLVELEIDGIGVIQNRVVRA